MIRRTVETQSDSVIQRIRTHCIAAVPFTKGTAAAAGGARPINMDYFVLSAVTMRLIKHPLHYTCLCFCNKAVSLQRSVCRKDSFSFFYASHAVQALTVFFSFFSLQAQKPKLPDHKSFQPQTASTQSTRQPSVRLYVGFLTRTGSLFCSLFITEKSF